MDIREMVESMIGFVLDEEVFREAERVARCKLRRSGNRYGDDWLVDVIVEQIRLDQISVITLIAHNPHLCSA